MDYKNLEQEIKERKEKLTAKSWRGDLTKRGLQSIQWGDQNNIKSEVINKKNLKYIKRVSIILCKLKI